MVKPGEQNIETARLTLVPFSLELVQAAMTNKPRLAELLSAQIPDEWPLPDFAEVLPIIARSLKIKPAGAEWDRLVIHTATNTLIGDVGLKGGPDTAGVADICYSIIPAYQNQGYASEAARRLIEWAVYTRGLKHITADCYADNLPSIRVLETLGMQRLAPEGNLLKWFK